MRRFALLVMLVMAGGTALAVLYLLRPLAGEPISSTLGMGLGVGWAVYADRRWLRRFSVPAREAVLYGAATAAGWAVSQIIGSVWL